MYEKKSTYKLNIENARSNSHSFSYTWQLDQFTKYWNTPKTGR